MLPELRLCVASFRAAEGVVLTAASSTPLLSMLIYSDVARFAKAGMGVMLLSQSQES